MEMGDAALGSFLRARRERVDPSDLGFPANPRRRTPGLRREEVASLAGVSVEYLTRLEQGRSSRPSVEVLDALARALRLDRNAHLHLRILAGAAPPPPAPAEVRESLLATVEALAPKAAYLMGPTLDILASTPAARAVFGPVCEAPEPNFLRWFFLDERSRERHPHWAGDAASAVAVLRMAARPGHDDPRFDALVAELSAGSAEFRRLWAGHEVRPCMSGLKVLRHPEVGELTLAYDSFASLDQAATLIILRPTDDERSRTAYELLTTVTLDFSAPR
jgi:transcriptional regulator with XRE-family HTH domain